MKNIYFNFINEPQEGSNLNSAYLNLFGILEGDTREAKETRLVLDEVRQSMGPYSTCAEADQKTIWLSNALADVNRKITSGETDAVGKRYKTAFEVLLTEVSSYITTNCLGKQATGAGTTDTAQTVMSTGVTQSTSTVAPAPTKINYILVAGISFLVLVVGGVIMYKLAKKK